MATDKDFKVKNGLQVDTDTLVVDATNDRVGINKASPTATLDIDGTTLLGTSSYSATIDTITDGSLVVPQGSRLVSESSSGQYLRTIFSHESSNGHYIFGQTGTSLIGDMKFYAGSSGNFFFASGGSDTTGLQVGTSTTISYQPIRISSGGLQIGTTEVITSARNLTNIGTITSGSHTSTGDVGFAVNSGGNAYMVIDRSASNRRGALVFSTAATDVTASPPAIATIDWSLGVSDSDEVSGDKFYIRQGTTDASGSALLIDSSNNATFANGVTIEGTTTFNDDASFSNDALFGDNSKAIFGAGSDLQIYHTGSASVIRDTGAGSLYIDGASEVFIRGVTSFTNMIKAVDGGQVELYHNNLEKLATTSTGIDVTGVVEATGYLAVEGTSGNTGSAGDRWIGGDGTAGTWFYNVPTGSNHYFAVNNTNQVAINATGVGIGTSSPDNKLTIGDSATIAVGKQWGLDFQDTVKGEPQAYIYAEGRYTANYNTDLTFGTIGTSGSATERMRIDSNGGVVIGDTSIPQYTNLKVYEEHFGGMVNIGHSNTGGTFPKVSAIGMGSDAVSFAHSTNNGAVSLSGSAQIAAIQTASSGAVTDMAFYTTSGGSVSERMRIDSSGNVGIGTSSPIANLQVGDGTGSETLLLLGSNSNTTSSQILFGDNTAGADPYEYGMGIRYDSSNNVLHFDDNYNDGGSANNVIMTIDRDDQRVGIGQTNPTRQLHLTNSANALAKVESTGANYAGIDFENTSRLWYAGIRTELGHGFGIKDEDANRVRLAIDTSGNVDIPQGNFEIGGQTVITSARALQNITSISATDLTTQNNLTIASIGSRDLATIGSGSRAGAIKINDIDGANYFIAGGGFDLTFYKNVSGTSNVSVMQFVGANASDNTPDVSITNNLSTGGTIHATQSANDVLLRATTTGAGAYVRLDSTTSGYYGIQMTGGNPLAHKWFIGSYGTNDFTIKPSPSGTTYLRVDNSGNQILGSSSARTTGGTAKLSVESSSVALNVGLSNNDCLYVRRIDTGDYQFQTYNGANDGDIQLQPYGGRVGIGDTAPPSTLTVLGDNSADVASVGAGINGLQITRTTGSGENLYAYIGNGSFTGWSGSTFPARIESFGCNVLEIGSQQSAPISFGTNNTERMRITSGGTVGIATTSPSASYKLDVNGKIRSQQEMLINTGSLFVNQEGEGIHLISPNGTEYKITVDNSGNLVATEQ